MMNQAFWSLYIDNAKLYNVLYGDQIMYSKLKILWNNLKKEKKKSSLLLLEVLKGDIFPSKEQ